MERLLGRAPEKMTKTGILLTWLRDAFGTLPEDPTELDLLYAARAYILDLIGSVILTDSSHNKVAYKWLMYVEYIDFCGGHAWGSAVLSNLYSEMTRVALKQKKELCGCPFLLQVWSWMRIPFGRPNLLENVALNRTLPLGCRWNVYRSMSYQPDRAHTFYRDMIDTIELSHVSNC